MIFEEPPSCGRTELFFRQVRTQDSLTPPPHLYTLQRLKNIRTSFMLIPVLRTRTVIISKFPPSPFRFPKMHTFFSSDAYIPPSLY